MYVLTYCMLGKTDVAPEMIHKKKHANLLDILFPAFIPIKEKKQTIGWEGEKQVTALTKHTCTQIVKS